MSRIERIKQKAENTAFELGLLSGLSWAGIEQTFIVSTGRTGTKFFFRFFDLCPNVYARHEPDPDFLNLAIEYAAGGNHPADVARIISRERKLLCYKTKQRKANIYVESNNRVFSLLRPLRKSFPEAKIIHIVRDGRDYVRSGMSRKWYTENDKLQRLQATMFQDDPFFSKWPEMNRFEKIAWRWQKKDGFIYQDTLFLENVLRVRFEDIFRRPDRKGLYEIARFVGLNDQQTEACIQKMGERKVGATSKYAIPRWQDWDDSMIAAFDEIAGDHMKRFYAQEYTF